MSRAVIEQQLSDVVAQLHHAEAELALLQEDLDASAGASDDARLRSFLAETPGAGDQYRQARGHTDALVRSRSELESSITELQRVRDELTERLHLQSDETT